MKRTINFLLPIFVMLLSIHTTYAQDTIPERKNSFYISLGGEGNAFAFNYEGQLWQKDLMSLRARLGFGFYISSMSWDIFGDGGMHFGFSPAFPVGAEFLYGKRNKLDVAAGVILALGPDVLSEAEKSPNAWPWIAVGYRYVSRSQKFMFRIAPSVSMHEIVPYDNPDQKRLVFPIGFTIGLGGNF